jgi:hypothetical protein
LRSTRGSGDWSVDMGLLLSLPRGRRPAGRGRDGLRAHREEKEPGGALADGPDEGLSYYPGACGRVPRGDPRVWRTESSGGGVPLSPLSTREWQQSGMYVCAGASPHLLRIHRARHPGREPSIDQEDPRRRDPRQTHLLKAGHGGVAPSRGVPQRVAGHGVIPLEVFGPEGVDMSTGGGYGSLVEAQIWAGPDGGFTTCSRPPAHAASTVHKPMSAHTPAT